MAITTINKNFKNKGKDIKYLNKDFAAFRENLIEFSKTYFPKTYSDFNETSPGMMFIELASYVGDSLSYYVDDTLKESLMPYAEDIQSVIALAQFLGYKPKVVTPAVTTLTVYQLVLAKNDATFSPDENYYLKVKAGLEVQSSADPDITFITTDSLDFQNPTHREINVYERDNQGQPTKYLVAKKIKAISAREVSTSLIFDNDADYPSMTLNDTNIIQITSVKDSEDSTTYYEVPYLAQESIFVEQPNIQSNSDTYQSSSFVPYIFCRSIIFICWNKCN